jgi:hypothetical protein
MLTILFPALHRIGAPVLKVLRRFEKRSLSGIYSWVVPHEEITALLDRVQARVANPALALDVGFKLRRQKFVQFFPGHAFISGAKCNGVSPVRLINVLHTGISFA